MLALSNKLGIGKASYSSKQVTFNNEYSLSFDGTDDYVQLTLPSSNVSHTIAAWVNCTDATGNRAIFDGRDGNNDGIFIYAPTNDKINYKISSGAVLVQGGTKTTGSWQHIVCTYDGSTQNIYINGSLSSSQSVSAGVSTTTAARIGGKAFASGSFWSGLIDEVALWGDDLSSEEVTAVYNSGTGFNLTNDFGNYVSSADLRGYWRFNEGQGTHTIDESTTGGNDGLIVGATWSTTTY